MKNLIEALTIFAKYQDLQFPTHCGHDELMIMGITLDEVSAEDQTRLNELGFNWNKSEGGYWYSFRYGSA